MACREGRGVPCKPEAIFTKLPAQGESEVLGILKRVAPQQWHRVCGPDRVTISVTPKYKDVVDDDTGRLERERFVP